MAITAQEVKKLREITGAGMMDCKKALTEADGDFDKAIEFLRKKGQKLSEKRADRETTEGNVFIKTNDDKTHAFLISLTCETDFVSKNEDFQKFGNEIIEKVATEKPADLEALKAISYEDITVGEKVIEMVGKIGEKIEISHYETLTGEAVVSYVHAGAKLGVLVALKNTDGKDVTEAGKDVAMQVAAMKPLSVTRDGVDSTLVEKELEIAKDQLLNEGKPEHIAEQAAKGKLRRFYEERVLLEQKFVKDNGVSVKEYLEQNDAPLVKSFHRLQLGEND
jgi:elongation factor Ts